jgi:hypothetical protein
MLLDFQEHRNRIVNSVAQVDVTFLNKLRDELEYGLDIRRMTKGSHIEYL